MSTQSSSAFATSGFANPGPIRYRVARAKIKATLIHLLVSALIFLPFLYLLWYVWYPMPYFVTDGGWQGMRIMLAIDMVIGPFLTALVFHPDKTRRALTVDYTIIALVQIAALAWGTYTVESQRPRVVSFHQGYFTALIGQRFENQPTVDFDSIERMSDERPPVVFAPDPSRDESKFLMEAGTKRLLGAHELVERFQPFHERWEEIRKTAIDMEKRSVDDPEIRADWQGIVAKWRKVGKELTFYGLMGRFRTALVALDDKGKMVDWIFLPEEARTPAKAKDAPSPKEKETAPVKTPTSEPANEKPPEPTT